MYLCKCVYVRKKKHHGNISSVLEQIRSILHFFLHVCGSFMRVFHATYQHHRHHHRHLSSQSASQLYWGVYLADPYSVIRIGARVSEDRSRRRQRLRYLLVVLYVRARSKHIRSFGAHAIYVVYGMDMHTFTRVHHMCI